MLSSNLGTFLGIYSVCYFGTLVLYFVQGGIIVWINRRHQGRRIQPDRRGEDRARIEIIQSVKSLLATCFCLAAGLFAQWKGWTLFAPMKLNWLSGIGMLLVSAVVFDAWFYWGHRLMHTRALYKHHRWHHRSVAPTVWSNYSDSMADAFVMQSFYFFAPLVIPAPAFVLIALRIWDHINGQFGHSGFEYFADRSTRTPSPMVCVTFHDQHHEHFHYNFANFFSLWDRICGTLHPGYDEQVRKFEHPPSP
jgi:sterol desaturase/sphingolipid hydroxylase (fatty acid hydroxylase superfamily)